MLNCWLNTSRCHYVHVPHLILISDLSAIHRCYCRIRNGRNVIGVWRYYLWINVCSFSEFDSRSRNEAGAILHYIHQHTNLKLKWASFVMLWPSFFQTMRRCKPLTSFPLCRVLSDTSISFSRSALFACDCGACIDTVPPPPPPPPSVTVECKWCDGELCGWWCWSNIFGSGASLVLLFLMNAVATWHVRSMVLPIL